MLFHCRTFPWFNQFYSWLFKLLVVFLCHYNAALNSFVCKSLWVFDSFQVDSWWQRMVLPVLHVLNICVWYCGLVPFFLKNATLFLKDVFMLLLTAIWLFLYMSPQHFTSWFAYWIASSFSWHSWWHKDYLL